ncbi:vWA domain-containing protein [Elongatibacter sediminis]|uniref:VWFA domain-containing protein n=1 Tax=Elongatibacter sediminis TaxID=3119006 RepID=A0AAW9R9M7_9GAMM
MIRIRFIAVWVCAILLPPAVIGQDNITLDAPASAGINEAIEVQTGGTPARGDTVRFADTDGNLLGGSYAYVGLAKNGLLTLSAPVDPGEYQVVYVSGGEIIAHSPLTVQAVEAMVEVPQQVGMNDAFDVQFSGPANKGDTLRIADSTGKAVGRAYAYVGLAKNNKISLRAPAQAGDYRVEYVTGRKVIGSAALRVFGVQADVTIPATVPAGAVFQANWNGPANHGDRLRVRDSGGRNTGSYGYVGINPKGVTLRAPEEPGTYEVVYLTGDQVIGTAAFDVTGVSAELDAPDEAPGNERFEVHWTGPGNYGDVIRLFPDGADDDVAYTYIEPGDDTGVAPGIDQTVFIHAPATPGVHELRYVSHGGTTLASRRIDITPPTILPGSLQVLPGNRPALGPGDAVEIILDASGSMLQRQNGERRITIAKRTLDGLISETLPAGTPLALRVFGHREADSCRTDLEIPLKPLDRAGAAAVLAGITAMNLAKTPIADSLAHTEPDLAGVSGERIIVLVTDGEETCDGNPADVIAAMRSRGIDIRFNIVGYAIDDPGLRETFERWAALGGGAYFNADDEVGLAAGLTRAVNPSFDIVNADGEVIGRGVAGADPVSLMPGQYTVRLAERTEAIEIQSDRLTTLEL